MNCSLALLSTAALFAASATAQCFSATGTSVVGLMSPTSTYPIEDEGRTSDIALPFAFPIAGGSYTHVVIGSNGGVYFTDGTGAVGASTLGISSIGEMAGPAGGSPRLCAFGGDLQGVVGLAGWDILTDDTVSGSFKITWTGMRYYAGSQNFAMSATLDSAGGVTFSYAGDFGSPTNLKYVGISAGNAVVSSGSVDLSAGGDTGVAEICYQNLWGWDLANTSITIVPNGTSGFSYVQSCVALPASHTNYGTGCYDINRFKSVHQLSTGAAALSGAALSFTPNGAGYTLDNSAAAFVTPVAPTTLTLGDDANALVNPSVPFNYLGTTPISNVYVCSNGFVDLGAANSVFAYGSTSTLNSAANPTFRCNIDLNPGAAGSGQVLVEEMSGVLYVTYDGVYRFSTTDAQTFQFQMDLATGVVNMVFVTMGTGGSTVIGFNNGGTAASNPINFATQLPFATTATDFVSPAMSMSASPAPISTPTSGTTVTYTMSNVPDSNVNTGIRIGVTTISWSGDIPGTDLGFLGAPGCNLHVGSFDILLPFIDTLDNSTLTTDLAIPAGILWGTTIYAQAAALVVPGSLPNGQNAFGATTSNGIESVIKDF